MILIDEMKSMKIYKQPTFLPTLKDDKKKKSAILLLTPSYESSKKLMNHHLFKNVRRYMSYYLEKDVSYYIGSKDIEEVDENALIKAFLETSEYFEETKRSELPDDAFGVPSKRKFPLDTEAHVRSAIKFFNYVDPEDEAELARRIIAAMKKFNITDVRVSEKNRFSKYYTNPKKSTNEEVEIKEFYNYCGVEIYKSINETSIVNAKVLYHVSRSNLNNKTIKPSIPDNYFTKNGYEENKTPRVCFATSIDKCLRGLSQNCTNMELYVHVPDDISKYEVLKPNNKEVPDSVVTSERWICSPVNMKCIGKIKVTGDRGEDGLPFSYGDNKTAELYDWNWEWAEKYNESDPIEESILINEKDIYYNKDKFDSGEINLCFITGHSGSGKSTMSHKSENDTLEVYEMDDLQCIKDRFTMENLKEYGDLIYSYFNGPGKQFYVTYKELMEKNVPGSDYEDKLYPGFVNYAKQYAAKHKDKKYILEGVWLFCDDEHGKPYFKPEEFKDYAFYIKGTSAIISKFRAAKRDSQYEGGSEKVNKGFNRFKAFTKDFFTKNWKWYLIDEKRIKVFRDYFKNKPETVLESYVEETMNSEDFLSVVEEAGGLNIGDKVLFFNEDSSQTTNAQLKKLLFKSRIRYRKEVIALLDKVKAENPWIIYAFPEMKRLAGKNVFIDLYFYNGLFFENNVWKMKRGMSLYSEFMNRLLNHPNLKQNGYKKKTIFIPVEDWDINHNGTLWNYRLQLSPISVIYQMMFENQYVNLKNTFGDTDILFIGNNSYFKINFAKIDPKEIKKLAVKFRLFVTKISKQEEFDAEDVDDSTANTDSTEVIKNKIVDKIELAKGVDLTKKVSNAQDVVKKVDKAYDSHNAKISKATTKAEIKKDFKELDKALAKADPDPTKTSQSTDNKKKVKKEKEVKQKEIERSTKSKLAKSEEEDTYDVNNNDTTEKDLEVLARAIAKASEDNDTEDDALDNLDNEEIRRILISMSNDDQVDISPTRAARITKLDNEVLDKEVNGRTVRDILEEKPKEEKVTKVNIASPNDEWNELKFVNFDKDYDIEKDIISIFRHFANCSRPISIRDIKVSDSSTSEDRTMLYDVKMEDYRGSRFTIKLDIPIMEDNRFLLRGNYTTIKTQFFNMPIIKTEVDTCQLISNYNKIFLYRFGSTIGKSSPIVARILKASNKYKGRKIKFTTGYNLKVSNKYQLPIDYVDLSSIFSYIETEDHIIYFNQDEIREKYVVEENKGIPFAYHKKENAIIYYIPTDNGVTFDKLLLDILFNAAPDFAEVFNTTTRPNSCMYTRASIMSSKIPLIIICGYYIGLRATLDRAKIKYRIENKLTTDDRKNINLDWIRFDDGYVIYEQDYSSNLLMNGLKICSTDLFKLEDIDSKNMYLEFLDNFGGRIKADGLDNFRDLFVDPMIKESLEYYKLPTDFIDILLYGNAMMADNKFIKHTDTSSRKLRRYQLIAAYTYKVLSSAYAQYSNMLKHNSSNASFDIKRSAVIDMFLTDNITSPDSIINALRDVETTNEITTKGPSGMNSDRAYSLDKRSYDESMINVLGMSTGFAGNVGITRQATIDANVTPDGYVKNNNGETETMNDVNTLTATESIIPMSSTHDDPMRTAMSFIQTSKHSVRTEESDPLLVTNGADEAMIYLTTNRFAYKAKMDGKILELTEKYILVEYKDGSKDLVSLEETIEHNSDGGYYVPLKLDAVSGLRSGMNIKENQILAYDHYSFSNSLGESDNLAYNVGKLAKVAIVNTDEGFEDSGIISQSMANKLATRIDIQYSAVVNKDSKIFSMMKVGDHVEAADDLIIWEDTFDDEDTADMMDALSNGTTDFSDLGKRKLKSEVTGTLKGIKIYRTVELDEMSESVRKVVRDYEKPIKELAKVAKDNNISLDKIPAHYVLPPTGKLKKSQNAIYIEFYVEYLDTVGVGDKVVYNAANKAVEKGIFPPGKEPYTDFRPNEEVSCFISDTSISKRLVTSIPLVGALQKLMIELDRSVKDIMDIPYDDSTV